jgi:hypothetical protein
VEQVVIVHLDDELGIELLDKLVKISILQRLNDIWEKSNFRKLKNRNLKHKPSRTQSWARQCSDGRTQ